MSAVGTDTSYKTPVATQLLLMVMMVIKVNLLVVMMMVIKENTEMKATTAKKAIRMMMTTRMIKETTEMKAMASKKAMRMMMTKRMAMTAMTPPTMWYLTVLQGLYARLHLVQILQNHLTHVEVATRRYTHQFYVETLF